MEEQRQRQEDEARRAAVVSAAEAGISSPAADGGKLSTNLIFPFPSSIVDRWVMALIFTFHVYFSVSETEDALLKMSVPHADPSTPALPDFSRMTEDEQIAYALQMSMQGPGAGYTYIFKIY